MSRLSISLVLLLAQPLLAAEPLTDGAKSPIALLPEGSVLKGVLLPRYDENSSLVGDLKAETLTLIDAENIRGKNVTIRFFQPDRTLRGKIELTEARFNQVTSNLYADEPVEMRSDRLYARGSGLAYGFEGGEGFLRGPAVTWIKAPPTTSMNLKTLTTPAMASVLATSLAIAPVRAEKPADVSPEELAKIEADAASRKQDLRTASSSAADTLASQEAEGDKASTAARAFIQNSGIRQIADNTPDIPPSTEPLAIEPGPGDTVIRCDDGMFFDSEQGVLVYLGNVRVTDPRFTLEGVNELKIFFDQPKPAEKAEKKDTEKPEGEVAGKAEEKEKKSDITANFGDVQRLIATGAVRILQKGVDGKAPVEASGRILTYDIPKGEIIIRGGFPWVKQGNRFLRAKEADLTLRLLNDNSFTTRGNWEMGGPLNLEGQ